MSKHDEKREKTRQEIREAFWTLYKKKGIGEIHVKEITDMVGCHRATFYLHYTDVYALLSDEVNEIIAFLESRAPEFKKLSMGDSLKVVEKFFEFYGEKIDLLLGIRYSEELVSKFREIMYPILKENMGMDDSIEANLICEFTIQGMQSAFRYWYREKDEVTLEQLTMLLQSIVLKGSLNTAVGLVESKKES